jgi:8-oxo-dGTP pyrophosphatase MutT (NUDIX family)
VVFVHRNDLGVITVQLQKRSAFAHEGGTWSCAGGAIEPGESPLEAGLREASEEVGEIPQPVIFHGDYVFAPAFDWKYVTSVVQVTEQFGNSINFETDEVEWFEPARVDSLDLHNGFAAAWPELRLIIDQVQRNTE